MVEDTENPTTHDSTEWVTVRVAKEASFESIEAETKAVRILGPPYLWFIERLLAHTQNLERIRVVPSYAHMVEPDREGGKLLLARGIVITQGLSGNRVGRRTRGTSSSFQARREFMLSLDEEQQLLLAELKEIIPEDLGIVSRYLCLGGEDLITLEELAKERDISRNHIQDLVGKVLYYLDSPIEVSEQAIERARTLEERVKRFREEKGQREERQAYLAQFKLTEEDLPAGFPIRFAEDYALIRKAWRHDGLSEYFVTRSERRVLVRRYGLEGHQFRTLEEVGAEMGLTRERIRQLETVALRRLRQLEHRIPPSSV